MNRCPVLTIDQHQRMRAALHDLGLTAKTADERRAFGLASYYATTDAIDRLVKAAQEPKP